MAMAMAQGGIISRYQRGDKVKNEDFRTEEVRLADSHIANIKKLAAAGKLTQEVMQEALTISKNNPDLLAYLQKEYNFISANEMSDIDRQISRQESEGQNKLPTDLPPKTPSKMQADADTSSFLGKLARASAGSDKFNPEGLSGSDLTRMSDKEMGIPGLRDVSPEEVSTYRKTGDYKGLDFSSDPNDNRITRQKMPDSAIENRLAATMFLMLVTLPERV